MFFLLHFAHFFVPLHPESRSVSRLDYIKIIITAVLTILSIGFEGDVFAGEPANRDDVLSGLEGRRRIEAFEKRYEESQDSDDLNYQYQCLCDLLAETRRQNDNREEGSALLQRTVFFYNNNMNDSIWQKVPSDLDILRRYGLWNYYYEDWMHLVNSYIFEGNSKKGLSEVQEMFDDAMKRNNAYGMGMAYYGMGNAYTQMNNREECIESYEKSLEVLSGISPLPAVIPEIYNYYGDALNDMGDYDKLEALTVRWKEFLLRFIDESKLSFTYYADICWSYYYIACTQAKLGLGKLDEAEKMLAGAKEHIVSEDSYEGMSLLFYEAQFLLQTGRYEEAEPLYRGFGVRIVFAEGGPLEIAEFDQTFLCKLHVVVNDEWNIKAHIPNP